MTRHNPDLFYAFMLSLLFTIMDAAVFMLSAEPLGGLLTVAPPLGNLLHALLVFTLGTLLGCLSFWIVGKNKRLVPLGYSFFALYLLIGFVLIRLGIPAENQAIAWEMLAYCGAVPTVVGIGISWGLYSLYKKEQ